MKRRIELRRAPKCWVADMVGDEEIRALFGTTALPLPFTPAASFEGVRAHVLRIYPDAQVVDYARVPVPAGGACLQPEDCS